MWGVRPFDYPFSFDTYYAGPKELRLKLPAPAGLSHEISLHVKRGGDLLRAVNFTRHDFM